MARPRSSESNPAASPLRTTPFAMVPHANTADPRIKASAFRVACAIASWDWGRGCCASVEKIATRAATTTRTVRSGIAELKKFGYLREVKNRTKKTGRVLHLTWPTPPGGVADPEQAPANSAAPPLRLLPPGAAEFAAEEDSSKKKPKEDAPRPLVGCAPSEIEATLSDGPPSAEVASLMGQLDARLGRLLATGLTEGQFNRLVSGCGRWLAEALYDPESRKYYCGRLHKLRSGEIDRVDLVAAFGLTRQRVEATTVDNPGGHFQSILEGLVSRRAHEEVEAGLRSGHFDGMSEPVRYDRPSREPFDAR